MESRQLLSTSPALLRHRRQTQHYRFLYPLPSSSSSAYHLHFSAAATTYTNIRLKAICSSSSSAGQYYSCCNYSHESSMNGSKAPAGSGGDWFRTPVEIRQTQTLPEVSTPSEALTELKRSIEKLRSTTDQSHLLHPPSSSSSGIIRLQVPIREQADAINWLHSQSISPCFYFSARSPRNSVFKLDANNGYDRGNGSTGGKMKIISSAGVGSAVYFQQLSPFSLDDWCCIKRFLSQDCPFVRAYGAMRFDPSRSISLEWKPFGAFYFLIPQVEINELEGSAMLATTLAWDESLQWSWQNALDAVHRTISQISASTVRMPQEQLHRVLSIDHMPDVESWELAVEKALKLINATDYIPKIHKVVLARRSRVLTEDMIDPLPLLNNLKDEGRHFYQFYIQPANSPAFIGNTPEQLFHRFHLHVSSEAVAGTRARGKCMEEDLQIEREFNMSAKDHLEFKIVKQMIKKKLQSICSHVSVEPEKAILKLPRVQHLYASIIGKLQNEHDEFDVLSSLHPTPAVCGFPADGARQFIEEIEQFDRGLYAGPVGWFGGSETEFAVGIRSGLVGESVGALVYAGAGIVKGTSHAAEWLEIELKASQLVKFIGQNKKSLRATSSQKKMNELSEASYELSGERDA